MNAQPLPQLAVICSSLPASALFRGDRRMEGESYLSGGFALRRAIEASGPVERLGKMADIWMPGRLKGIPAQPGKGVPFLTASQMFDVSPVPRKWLAPDLTPDIAERFVEPDWILVACSGTNNVGDVTLSYAPHKGIVASHDLLRMRVHDPAKIGPLYAFLKGRYGHAMFRACQYGSIIKHLEPEHLHDLPVPALPPAVGDSAGGRIRRCFRLRDEAFGLIRRAEAVFAESIGVPVGNPPPEDGYSVPASSIFIGKRRVDGYFYNPKAAAVLAALRESGHPIESLGSVVKDVILPNRFKREPVKEGLAFVGSEELFKVNPRIDKFIRGTTEQLVDYYPKRGSVLVARSGQIYGIFGTAVLADRWHETKVVSEDIIRIIPADAKNAARPGYLVTAINHPDYGRPLVLRSAFGTSIPHLAPDDLRDFPLIRLGEVEANIAAMVEKAAAIRAEADELEDSAAREVEQAVDAMLGKRAGLFAEQHEPAKPKRKKA